jgi:hypothetical protein
MTHTTHRQLQGSACNNKPHPSKDDLLQERKDKTPRATTSTTFISSEDYHNIIIPYSTIITIVIILENYE